MIALTMSDTGTVNGASRTQDKTRTANRRDPMVWVIKPAVWVLCLAPLAWLGWLVAETIFFGGRGLTAGGVQPLIDQLGARRPKAKEQAAECAKGFLRPYHKEGRP